MTYKTIRYSAAAILVSGLLSACGGGQVIAGCTYPNSPSVEAPGWICDEPVSGVEVSAVGSAEKSAAGTSFMKTQAATTARVQLAQNVQVEVSNMVKNYVETTGIGDNQTVDKVATSVTKQITAQTLNGSRIYKSRTGPSGTIYVLVGMNPAAVAKTAKTAVTSSMGKDKALWQQFRSKKAQDELADEISKMKAK